MKIHARTFRYAVAAKLVFVALVVAGCGVNPYARGRSVVGGFALAEITVGQEWDRIDAAKGRAILDAAHARPTATREEIQGELATWRVTSDAVTHGIHAVAEATVAAGQAVDAAEAAREGLSLVTLIAPIYHAAVALEHALTAAGIKLAAFDAVIALVRPFAPTEPPPPDGEGR